MNPRISPNKFGAAALLLFAVLCGPNLSTADNAPIPTEPSAERGFEILTQTSLSMPLAKIDELNRVWTVWESAERVRAEAAKPEQRRTMTFERYGFVQREFDDSGLPLGYTDDGRGGLVTNCFSCHGGKVAGRSMPGAPNTHQDMTAFYDDLAALRRADRGHDPAPKPASEYLPLPFGFVKGSSNATMFSIWLGSMRDENLDLRFPPEMHQEMVHNDIDPPAWWLFKKKDRIYCDAMAPKTARTLMQFTMAPTLAGEKIRSWEPEFHHIRAYIETLEAPKYPFEIDAELAAKGEPVFNKTCARCHGTYGPDAEYPNEVIPIKEIGTDRVRLRAIAPESKESYNKSWFSHYGENPVDVHVTGYIAPPLDGIWATAPYFHNASTPTIWHVFHPEERPKVWKRTENGYDTERVGLEVAEFEAVPEGLSRRAARAYYDTATPSHSAKGHLFPDQELNEEEKIWVIEYLKTL